MIDTVKLHLGGLKDSRRSQRGTTLIELMVAITIAALALALIVGTISTSVIDANLAKRNTAAQAVLQYEMERVSASTYSAAALSYSECFATENPASPAPAAGYGAACPSGGFTLRADVNWQWLPSSTTVQVWTIAVSGWPSGVGTGNSVQVYKTRH